MDSSLSPSIICGFCGQQNLTLCYSNLYHKLKLDHGPFQFYECNACGSGVTAPLPTAESLSSLYASFQAGLPNTHREILESDPQSQWYLKCIDRMTKICRLTKDSQFTWIEVGAGAGEMSALMLNRYPNAKGIAIDLHERPSRLKNKSIEWIQLDLNEDGFAMKADRKADVVYATAVWEHVQYPASFVRNLIHFLNPGGTLYLVCPNYGSIARFVLRTSWPFFTPGEHLNMPTLKGARCCLSSQVRAVKGHQQIFKVWVRPILLPYTVHYVLARFGMQRLAKFFRFLGSVPLPAGALEAALSISEIPDGKIGES